MARPLSEEKQAAILLAATRIFATEGIGASTSRIAKAAGVADGTLFIYFKTKDALFNQLYLSIKAEIAEAILASYPESAAAESRLRHVWRAYVLWGVRNPEKRKSLAQLTISNRISAPTTASAAQPLAAIGALIKECAGAGTPLSPEFAAAVMAALADVTVEFIAGDGSQAEDHLEKGFGTLLRALG